MHNNKIPIVFFLLIILIISFSGCTDLFNSNDGTVTYPNILTQISYDISYGIKINCTGSGVFNIKYSCDDPEVLSGYATDVIALNDEFELLTNQASFNYLYDWNISKTDLCSDYELGLEASIISNSFNVEDLNGEDALTIDEIKNNHPDKITNYCNRQANDTTVFIDPFDEDIRSKAIEIYENSDTNNSFLIAKELFIWLKSYTSYKEHNLNKSVQPANLTFNKKTGDCDDLTFLYLSLCRSLNIPARFIRGFLILEDRGEGHAWAEVYTGIAENNGWIPVECAGEIIGTSEIVNNIHQNFAFESADHLRLFIDDGSNESLELSLTGVIYSSDNNVFFDTPDFFAEINNYKKLNTQDLKIDKNNYRTLS